MAAGAFAALWVLAKQMAASRTAGRAASRPAGGLPLSPGAMKRIHVDAYTAILAMAVLAGAIAAILVVLNPIR